MYYFLIFVDSWALVLPTDFTKKFFAFCDFWMAQIVFFKLGEYFYHWLLPFSIAVIFHVFVFLVFVKMLLILAGFSVFGSFFSKEKPW